MRFHLTLLTTIALLSVGLTACQKPFSALKKSVPQPMPYHFTIGSILDSRSEQHPHENLNAHPLDRNELKKMLYKRLPQSLFATTPARLNVDIKEYTTTEHAGIHALSYVMMLSAHDRYGRVIVPTTQFICAETKERGFYLDNLAESAYKGESLANAKQSAKIFNTLINTCTEQTMTEFINALIAHAEQ